MKIGYLTFDLGRTKCCPVSYSAAKIEVATANGSGVQEEFHLHENKLFAIFP